LISIKTSNRPQVYLEIADEYEKYIKLGVIKNSEKLPSVRELAQRLGINPNTVSRAYQVLEERKLVSISPKRGVYVIYDGDSQNSLNDVVKDRIMQIKESGITKDQLIRVINVVYKGDDVNAKD